MFPIVNYEKDCAAVRAALAQRLRLPETQLDKDVSTVYERVAANGCDAVTEYTKRFDAADFETGDIFIGAQFVQECVDSLPSKLAGGIDTAIENISAVNRRIMKSLDNWTLAIDKGHVVGERVTPLPSALVWVPARKAPLISTAIMLCVAAKVAGVKKIILGTPPSKGKFPDRNTIAAAKLAGATDFVCGNGLAIVAAGATGNWPLGQTNTILGPGPHAVSLAMLYGAKYGIATQAGIGPSDSLIIFGGELDQAQISLMARNFLAEIEHGKDSYTYALTTDRRAAEALSETFKREGMNLFGKDAHYRQIAANHQAAIIVFNDTGELVEFANRFAPEHLQLFMNEEDSAAMMPRIETAGEILDGFYTPFVAANYCIGITAVLPTNGFARSYSGITSRNFVRFTSYGQLDRRALARLLPTIEAIGEAEGLPNHVEGARA
jgi:histidinol dehydrogenase